MSLASDERTAICDEFLRSGPDRRTLCAGWTSRELLGHLLVRERQPWAAVGIAVPALSAVTEKAMAAAAGGSWSERVATLRAGAPPWSPFRIGRIDALANGAEFFVHHEDVRRGEPGWEPRPADPVRDGRLWALLARAGRVFYRSAPTGVVLRRPTGEQQVVKTGAGVVTVVGEPGEIVLHAFGRDAVRVELEGDPADVAAFAGASRGV
jgi:uncharacterized protein (TIGR03085 family)